MICEWLREKQDEFVIYVPNTLKWKTNNNQIKGARNIVKKWVSISKLAKKLKVKRTEMEKELIRLKGKHI